MRRKDREMDRAFGLSVIDKALFGVMSLAEGDDLAYGVPLSFAREGDTLYFHSAREGKKAALIRDGAMVHIVFVSEFEIPSILSDQEAAEAAKDPEAFGILTSNLFTAEFESAMVLGQISSLLSQEEKINGLRAIAQKYTPRWMACFPQAVQSGLEATAVYAIDIKEVTAKRKKYDASGQEMKRQRME